MKTYRIDCYHCKGEAGCPDCEGSGMADYTLYDLVVQAVIRVGWDPDDVFADVLQHAPDADTYDIQEALNDAIDADDAVRKALARLHEWGL